MTKKQLKFCIIETGVGASFMVIWKFMGSYYLVSACIIACRGLK